MILNDAIKNSNTIFVVYKITEVIKNHWLKLHRVIQF